MQVLFRGPVEDHSDGRVRSGGRARPAGNGGTHWHSGRHWVPLFDGGAAHRTRTGAPSSGRSRPGCPRSLTGREERQRAYGAAALTTTVISLPFGAVYDVVDPTRWPRIAAPSGLSGE